MVEQRLEIRGIHRTVLIQYVLDLEARATDQEDTFQATGWECQLSPEDTFRFLQSDVPKVFVHFKADSQGILDEMIRRFRLKTFRAGG